MATVAWQASRLGAENADGVVGPQTLGAAYNNLIHAQESEFRYAGSYANYLWSVPDGGWYWHVGFDGDSLQFLGATTDYNFSYCPYQ